MKKNKKEGDKLASQLMNARYSGLFQYGEHNVIDAIWQDGQNEEALLYIVTKSKYDDYIRLLASEVLFAKKTDYPPAYLDEILSYIYPKALAVSGSNEGALLSGNLWGFMYFSDKKNNTDYGDLGLHLMKIGKSCVPNLAVLLNNNALLFYVGSQEATIGNSLKYRVKDAAAYYIGKLANIPVQFYENHADRDAEIERLKEKLKNQ